MPRKRGLKVSPLLGYDRSQDEGAIAQLGERLHGMQEVGGSIPPGSTSLRSLSSKARLARRLSRRSSAGAKGDELLLRLGRSSVHQITIP